MSEKETNNLTQSRKGAKKKKEFAFPFASWRLCASFGLFLILLAQISMAAAPLDPAHDRRRILAEISSADPKAVAAEIVELKITITTDPGFVIGMMRGPLLATLISHDHCQEAADLATLGILSNLTDLGSIQQLLQFRILALVKAKQPTAALGAAKALFNVCSLHDTEPMLVILAQAIDADHPTDPNAAQPLVDSEMAGAVAKDENTAKVSNFERSLPADPAFKAKAEENRPGSYLIPPDDWRAIDSQVNLLLLADEPAEAVKLLRALRKSDHFLNPRDRDEALARAIRAEDGTIGRANAFIKARNAEYATR